MINISSLSVRRNTYFNLLLSFSNVLFPVITMPYISRILLINDIGLLNKGNAVYALFINLASFGLAGYGAREIARYKNDKEKISTLFSSLLASHYFSIAVFLTAYICYIIFFIPLANERCIHVLYICLFAITPLSVEWLYIGTENFQYIAIRTFVLRFLLLISVFVFVHSALDFLTYAIISIAMQGANFLYNIVHARKYVRFSLKGIHIFQTIFLSKFFYLQTLVAVCYQNINQLILSKNKTELALFVRATVFSSLVSSLINPIVTAVKPRIEYLMVKDAEQYEQYIQKTFDCVLSVLFPIALGISAFSCEIMFLFGGKQFIAGAKVLAITSIASISTQCAVFLNLLISIPAGYEKNGFYSNALVALVSLPATIMLVPHYGAYGAAIALWIGETAGVIFHFLLIKKKCLYSAYLSVKKTKYLISALAMFCAVCIIRSLIQNMYLRLGIGVIMGAAIYVSTVLLCTKIFRDTKPYILQIAIPYIQGKIL